MAGLLHKHHSVADERAFLPASVEVLETPVSPLKHLLTLSICLIFILLLLWAWLGKIDVVVEAQGRVIPDTHVKTVSPIQVARVHALFVREGSYVEQGAILIKLATNPSDLESVVEQPRQEIITHQLNILRLDTLLETITNAHSESPPPFSDTVPSLQNLQEIAKRQQVWFPDQPNQLRWSIENETLFSELRNFHSTEHSLFRKIEEMQALLEADKAELEKLRLLRPIHDKMADASRSLFDKNMVSEMDWMTRREQQIETHQQERILQHRTIEHQARLKSIIAERELKKEELLLRINKDRLSSIQQLDHAKANWDKARQRDHNQTLRAPVAGVVQQLQVRSEGDVVSPGQPIMVIVPAESILEAEVMIENKDIHWLSPGQKVNVKLDTYPYTRYGHINGSVRHISRDAVNDEHKGWVFPARVTLMQSASVNPDILIQPGLTVTADVIVGRRRLLEFFLSPLLRQKKESFRETI